MGRSCSVSGTETEEKNSIRKPGVQEFETDRMELRKQEKRRTEIGHGRVPFPCDWNPVRPEFLFSLFDFF